MNLQDTLNWRYATKKMTGEKISQESLNAILEATRLSASSYGLQPYTIQVISNDAVKQKISPAAYLQPQIVDSSHLLVFCAWDSISEQQVDDYMNNIASTRDVPVEGLQQFKNTIWGTVKGLSEEQQQVWASKQAYIALGTALIAAAAQKVDATPMEGFSSQEVDKILGLQEKGLKSVAILALGKRSEADVLAQAPKVRRPMESLYQLVD